MGGVFRFRRGVRGKSPGRRSARGVANREDVRAGIPADANLVERDEDGFPVAALDLEICGGGGSRRLDSSRAAMKAANVSRLLKRGEIPVRRPKRHQALALHVLPERRGDEAQRGAAPDPLKQPRATGRPIPLAAHAANPQFRAAPG